MKSAAYSIVPAILPLLLMAATVPAVAAASLQPKLEALVEAGNGEAAYNLGMLYHLGLAGVPKDIRKAYELFKLSAELGDPLGTYKLGCFYDGQGEGVVESNSKLALKYKLIAAEAGYALAQEDVAKHLFGEGDMAGGLRWLEAAAAQGSIMPLMALGGLYSGQAPEGLPNLPADIKKSWTYFLIAAQQIPEMKKNFEAEARKALGEADYKRVVADVAAWREARTPLTQKADEGIGAAYKAAGLPVSAN